MKALLATALLVCSLDLSAATWLKGNLHTHTFWSDGDDFPEMIAGWYRDHGYQFLALTDHNILHTSEKWMPVNKTRNRNVAFAKYLKRWGADWVETREVKGKQEVRLKRLEEYRGRLEQPGRFLLIQAEEISARYLTAPIHLNASNLRYSIAPKTGANVVEVLQNNIDAVLKQEAETGQPMLPHVNHPNFRWAITAEELMRIRGGQFFELYNGHPFVFNRGDKVHANTERIWDIMNTRRLTELKLPLMFGLATDDSHAYHKTDSKLSNSGRGWVMVRCGDLHADSVIKAMKRGDFYASTGVELKSLETDEKGIRLAIRGQKGVKYRTQFIGTLKQHDATNQPVRNAAGEKLRITHRYSEDIGAVLAETAGTTAEYQFTGKELFVRAKVISDRPQPNPINAGDTEVAWTQPVRPGK